MPSLECPLSIPLERLSQTEQRGTVLLVDDEPAVTRTLARLLAGRGYDLETCSTATEAMQRVTRGGVLVVVTDIAMPHVSGVQLLRAVREHDPDVPVVLITGVPDIQTATAGIDWGAFKYLVKPVQADALCSAVDRAVQMHRLALMKRTALAAAGERDAAEQARLRESFERAIQTLWVAFQPIVRASDNSVFGYEALLRSDEPSLPGPG
ncbi:MAG TPA: response regulator, partial [Polyangiaceae bacterium]